MYNKGRQFEDISKEMGWGRISILVGLFLSSSSNPFTLIFWLIDYPIQIKRVLPHKFIPAKSFNIPAPLYHTGTGKTANRVSRLSFMIDLLTALH